MPPVEMTVEELQRLLQELLERWNQLLRSFDAVLSVREVVFPDEQEDELLKMRTWLIRRSQLLKVMMGKNYGVHGDLFKILSMMSSWERVKKDSPIIQENIKARWHEVLIALNKISGLVKERGLDMLVKK